MVTKTVMIFIIITKHHYENGCMRGRIEYIITKHHSLLAKDYNDTVIAIETVSCAYILCS